MAGLNTSPPPPHTHNHPPPHPIPYPCRHNNDRLFRPRLVAGEGLEGGHHILVPKRVAEDERVEVGDVVGPADAGLRILDGRHGRLQLDGAQRVGPGHAVFGFVEGLPALKKKKRREGGVGVVLVSSGPECPPL